MRSHGLVSHTPTTLPAIFWIKLLQIIDQNEKRLKTSGGYRTFSSSIMEIFHNFVIERHLFLVPDLNTNLTQGSIIAMQRKQSNHLKDLEEFK
jgi:hypothetical protein